MQNSVRNCSISGRTIAEEKMDLFFPVSHLNTFVLAACFGGLEATQQVAIFSSDYLTRLIYISFFFFFFFRNASTFGWAHWHWGCSWDHWPWAFVCECKEGMYSSLQPDLGGLKNCLLKCEELPCGKVSTLWSFRGQSRTNGQKLLRGRLWFNMGTWLKSAVLRKDGLTS